MARRRKMTPFARFFLVMLILVPAAFIGASLINGDDPVQKFKELVGLEEPEPVEIKEAPAPEMENTTAELPEQAGAEARTEEPKDAGSENAAEEEKSMEELKKRLERLEEMQEALRNQLLEQEKRIQALENPAQEPADEN